MSSKGHPEQLHAAAATTRLRAYLSAHDGGEWVPPRELAAAVADLVDALVLDRRQLLEDA